MNQTLRILHLEDNPADALLVRDLLEHDELKVEMRHVGNRAEFLKALPEKKWDVLISDYRLPDFTGLDALKIVREKYPMLPFILMSGTIGEQAAIESLKAGATDYVLKHNRDRLPSAVRRAVSEAAERAMRHEAQEELRRSEKQYRILFQGNPHPMWVFDLETLRLLEVNEAAVQHYGYARDEFLKMTLTDLRVPGGEGDKLQVREANTSGLIWRHRRKNGSAMDMEVVWSPLAFHGKLAALTMATDVTVRRRAALHNALFGKLSHQLSAVTTAAEAALFICEAADELFRWDDFALDLYSAEKDEVVSLLSIATIDGQRVEIPGSTQPQHANAIVRRVIARGAEVISAAETGEKSGTTMIAPIRKGERVIGVLFIQARRAHSYADNDAATLQTLADQCGGALQRVRAEEELRHSQQRFRDLFENSPDAIFVEDLAGTVLDANATAGKLHGVSREKLIGKNAVNDLVPAAHREAARVNLQKLAAGQISWAEGESLRMDGSTVPVEIRVVRIQFEGRPALLFHVRDVSERHAAEMALRGSEALFRSVWENSVDGMRLTDENGNIVRVNGAYCRLVGIPQDKLQGRPFSIVYAAGADWEQMLQNHRQNFRSRLAEQKSERNYTLHDGRAVVFEMTDTFVESEGQPRLLSLFRDITLQKRLEEQLRQSQKMEAIGQLAGGVAHDFNNILTIILGHASLLAMTPLEPKAMVSANQIKQASERAAGLTRQLLAFGRKQIVNPRPLDLNRVVGGMTEMLGRLLGEDIALQLNFSGEPAVVEADPTMLEQILLNLSVNSRDAMPRGGRLAIRISIREVDTAHIRKSVEASPGKFVCLSHTDTGGGIPPENLQRIFEPFFTTKELGKGTGLGLATVYGIVKQHKGWVEVESELGKGTTFNIFLPASSVAAPEIEAATETQFRSMGGTETVLVVEDERDLREIVTRTLNRHGYRVFQAVDGNNALQIWSEYKNEIQLVFTDVIMPGGMNGRELAEKLWAEKPQLKVIFSTGYGADALGKGFKLDPELNYLQKPYLPHALARIVRRSLDSKKH
ncbi:MAG: PAS domain S-box protein [Verrucomicrobiae bacterium]|nr:PAS domain S-box protein [Verrucomicrobiae bacterium]